MPRVSSTSTSTEAPSDEAPKRDAPAKEAEVIDVTPQVQPEPEPQAPPPPPKEDTSVSFKTKKKYPIRVYTAGPAPYAPQEIIMMSSERKLQFVNGALEIKNREDEVAVRRCMGGRIYDEDIPEDDAPLECPQTNWFTRSAASLTAHLRTIPVTAQG